MATYNEVMLENILQGKLDTSNSTTTPLDNGETFTGQSVLNSHSGLMLSGITDQDGVIYIDFSNDNINWDSTITIYVTAGSHEFHTYVKGPRWHRVRLVNNSGSNQTYLRLYIYTGRYRQGTQSLNSSVSLDSDGNPAIAAHNLGTDGSDETSFSGYGINTLAVSASGSDDYNASAITVTHTSSGDTMSFIPATYGVSQQPIFHVGNNHNGLMKYLGFRVNRQSGGNPLVQVKGYVYNRNVATRYIVFDEDLDTTTNTEFEFNESKIGFALNASDTLYFEADTNRDNTIISLRMNVREYQKI